MPDESRQLKLIEPCESLADEFCAFCAEFVGMELHGAGSMNVADPVGSVQLCRDHARGANLPAGCVPATTFWLVADDRTIVGTIQLRHALNAYLESEGGHIGYSVRPSLHGRGFATRMLAMCLEKVRQMGMSRVLVTCDPDNTASARVIIKNGGKLENEVPSQIPGRSLTQRYWIAL